MFSLRVLAGNFSLLIFVPLCLALKRPPAFEFIFKFKNLQEFTQTSPQIDRQVLNNTSSYSFWVLFMFSLAMIWLTTSHCSVLCLYISLLNGRQCSSLSSSPNLKAVIARIFSNRTADQSQCAKLYFKDFKHNSMQIRCLFFDAVSLSTLHYTCTWLDRAWIRGWNTRSYVPPREHEGTERECPSLSPHALLVPPKQISGIAGFAQGTHLKYVASLAANIKST